MKRLIASCRGQRLAPASVRFHSSPAGAAGELWTVSPVGVRDPLKGFKHWKSQVESGQYSGTFDAWQKENRGRKKRSSAEITTLQLSKALESQQYHQILDKPQGKYFAVDLYVSINGTRSGRLRLYIRSSCTPNELVVVYYDPKKGLLRFANPNGDNLPESTDIDLLASGGHLKKRPLILLAHAEGLIDKIPSTTLQGLDLQSNIDSGFYVRINRQANGTYDYNSLPILGLRSGIRFKFTPSDAERLYFRLFPYIHKDGELRMWDVEENRDIQLKCHGSPRRYKQGWSALEIKKKCLPLFELARRLGYWTDVS